MNILVILFFIHTVFATAYLGYRFRSHVGGAQKHFGTALYLNAAAFSMWLIALMSSSNLFHTFVSMGILAFVASLPFLVKVGAESLPMAWRNGVFVGSCVGAFLFVIMRFFVLPSEAYISGDGLLMFNVQPIIQMLYLVILFVVGVPAADVIAKKVGGSGGSLVYVSLLLILAGGATLATIQDPLTLNLAGWIMGIVYSTLWISVMAGKLKVS